jgi:hypothetical protein
MASLLLAGCAPLEPGGPPTPPSPPTTGEPVAIGTIEVRVTDAPRQDEVTSVLVTVSKVEVHRAVAEQEQEQQQVQEGEGEWLTLDIIAEANPFDLLKIKGVEEVLAVDEMAAGKYTQIRLTIDRVEVALGGGEPEEAKLPSGELKIVHPFDVVEGETTVLLLDFDAEKSVTVAGKDNIIVKPVVKLAVKEGKAEEPGTKVVTQEESQKIAEEFVRNEATFVFDGMEETLKLTETVTLRSPSCWQFTFEFESRQAGYGDREGQMLAEVITPHQAVITVEKGKITSAIMDEQWDMMKQKMLK